MQLRKWRLVIQVGLSVALIYGVLWNNREAPDIDKYLVPWLEHIRAYGPIRAFSVPFSDYAPPYLYMLAAASTLNLSSLSTIKLLSGLSAFAVSFSVYRLMRSLRPDKAIDAGAIALLLPTVILNGPMLGQCDGFWVAACVMAVAAAIERRTFAMAMWAGIGFAFKAQAIFVAPFAFAIVLRERKWLTLLIPPAVYLVAVAPAWMAGWSLQNLLTVYFRQYSSVPWLSTAPNAWAIPQIVIGHPPYWLFWTGYAATFVASALYVRNFRGPLVKLALLSAILVPWLLPKIHERYFLLADILSLAATFADRRTVPILIMAQLGSLLALTAYIYVWMPFIVFGSVFMTAALVMLLVQIHAANGDEQVASPNSAAGPECTPEVAPDHPRAPQGA